MPTSERTPDQYVHAFKTFLGLPPDTQTAPLCGATLTPAYNFPGGERPRCPECVRIMDAEQNAPVKATVHPTILSLL